MKSPHRFSSFTLLLALTLAAACEAAPRQNESSNEKTRASADVVEEHHLADWPSILGARRDGRSPEALDLAVWTGEGPKVLWERAAGAGFSGAAVVGEYLYFFDRHGDQARLVRLDAATGKEHWQAEYPTGYKDLFDYSNGSRANPLVDGDRVYTFGPEGRLRCHAVADGKVLWDVDTEKEYGVVQNFFGVGATPWVEGDLLIVPIGGSPPDTPDINSGKVQGNGTGVVAFDKKTGDERYRTSDELASYSSPIVTTLGDRRWAFVFARGGLLAFEPLSGKVDFHFPHRARKLWSVNAATPVVVDDLVFLTESYEKGGVLLRIRPDKPSEPEVVWRDPRRTQSLAAHWSTPVHHQGTLYGSHGESAGSAELRAVDLATGEVHWSKKGLGRATQIYADGHLIVLGERGLLLLLKATPEAYREVYRLDLGDRLGKDAWNPPALSQGRLYLRGSKALVALDLATPEASSAPAAAADAEP